MNKKMHLTRRHFLMGSLSAGAVVFVAACAPKQATAPEQVAPDTPKEEAKPAPKQALPINILIFTGRMKAYAAEAAAAEWNSQNESQVILDGLPAGTPADMKIQAAMAAGDIFWDGYQGIEFPGQATQWISRKLIQAWDPFLEVSSVPNADKVFPAVISTIRDVLSFEGANVWGCPGNVGSVGLAWSWDAFGAIDLEDQPYTWDGVYEAAVKIKQTKPELLPYGAANSPLSDLHTMIWSAQKNPYDENGLIDIRGEAAINALTWMRRMVEEGLALDTPTEGLGEWLKGGWAMVLSYDVAGTMAQQAFGVDKYETGINFFPDWPETNAGTPFWVNCGALLSQAPNPQGLVDFHVWWFGPDNDETGKQITQVAAKPCYTYTYDKFVENDPVYAWQKKAIDLVAQSVPFPKDTWRAIQNTMTKPYVDKIVDLSLRFEPQAWMDEAYKEIQDEIAKQR